MATIIVVNAFKILPPAQRWAKFVGPLSEELESSGLGRVVDIDMVRTQFAGANQSQVEEIAIELNNLHYGRDLIKQTLEAAGIERTTPEMPNRWSPFHCEDYFVSEFAEKGYWDEQSFIWLIEPVENVIENSDAEFLQVGQPGVDGIGFGYRKDQTGFWAYYPAEQECRQLAATIQEFLDGWLSGRITV